MIALLILLALQPAQHPKFQDPLRFVRQECEACEPECKKLQLKSEGIKLTHSPAVQAALLKETLISEGYKGNADRFVMCALVRAYDRAYRVLKIGRSKHLSEVQRFRWRVVETILRIYDKYYKPDTVKIKPRRKK